MKGIHLLAIGTNYTGESYELPDCEYDAMQITKTLKPFCTTAKELLGARATRPGILRAVKALLAHLTRGSLGLLYFSGHGTQTTVQGRRQEAIVAHGGTLVYEREIRALLSDRAAGSMLCSMADCCHSAGLAKGRLRGFKRSIPDSFCFLPDIARLPRVSKNLPDSRWLACKADELAYSTGNGGAYTLAFLEAFADRGEKTTLPALHKAIRRQLPSDRWPQTPQLRCDAELRTRTIKSFVAT